MAELEAQDPRFLFIARGTSKMKERAEEHLCKYFQTRYGKVQRVMTAPYYAHEHLRVGRERRKALRTPNIAYIVMERIETVQLILRQQQHLVAGHLLCVEAPKKCWEGRALPLLEQEIFPQAHFSLEDTEPPPAPMHFPTVPLFQQEEILEAALGSVSLLRPMIGSATRTEQLLPEPRLTSQVQVQRWHRLARSRIHALAAMSAPGASEQDQELGPSADQGPSLDTHGRAASLALAAWLEQDATPGHSSEDGRIVSQTW